MSALDGKFRRKYSELERGNQYTLAHTSTCYDTHTPTQNDFSKTQNASSQVPYTASYQHMQLLGQPGTKSH